MPLLVPDMATQDGDIGATVAAGRSQWHRDHDQLGPRFHQVFLLIRQSAVPFEKIPGMPAVLQQCESLFQQLARSVSGSVTVRLHSLIGLLILCQEGSPARKPVWLLADLLVAGSKIPRSTVLPFSVTRLYPVPGRIRPTRVWTNAGHRFHHAA